MKTGHAPRPVLLSLFWLTRWGMSLVEAEALNLAQLHMGMTRALKSENAALRSEIARLALLGDFGCANDPACDAPLPRPVARVVDFPDRRTPIPTRA